MSVFISIQRDAYEAIIAFPKFSALAAQTVFEDYGDSDAAIATALNLDDITKPDAPGYSIAVWPPAKGVVTDHNAAGLNNVETTIVVRFQVNPRIFTLAPKPIQDAGDQDLIGAGGDSIFISRSSAIADPGEWVGCMIDGIMEAVLAIDALPGGVKFQLSEGAFELVNYDSGLIAYHIRFVRNLPLGQ